MADATADHAAGLAQDAMARGDIDAVVAHLSAAIRGYTEAGRPCDAAMACARLGDVFVNALGNLTAARAWFARAERLVADQPDCIEQGWVAVAALGCEVDDPIELLRRAELALDRARRFGDVNLETKALADAGLAHVEAGRVQQGMALLDEAMALASTTADDANAAAQSVCSFFTACYYAADFERASSWTAPLRQRGLIGSAAPGPVFLSSHCDSVHASLLFELGRWSEAEAVLTKAIAEFEAVMPIPSWHPALALADLRVHQGRLADAEALLLGKDGHVAALLPTARLHLARGDLDLAAVTAERGLRVIGSDRLRSAELLAVVIEAKLRAGDVAGATAAADDLAARTAGLEVPTLRARSAAVQALVLEAAGDTPAGAAVLEAAVDGLRGAGSPWLEVVLRLRLARLHDDGGQRAAATVEARAASSLLATLDVIVPADGLTLLRRLGLEPGAAVAATVTASLAVEGRWCEVGCGEVRVRLQNTKGMRYLAELVRQPGVERHVLDLVDRIEGVEAGIDRRRLGDAGPALDAQARAAYRRQIEQLRAEIDDLLAAGDDDAAIARQVELDALVAELAKAFGLGGRDRMGASAAERARLNVTRALRAAVAKIVEVLPEPGAALDRHLRTGLYCAYEPGAKDIRWIVQSRLNETAGS